MDTQLITIEPIQPPDVRRPAKLSLLPPWVVERLAVLRREYQPDKAGKHREIPVLPSCLVLSGDQRMLIEQHVSALTSALLMTPQHDIRHGEATMTAVTKMLLVLPSRESGDLGGEAKGEAFMDALDDLPFWSVAEAMRKWHRAEHGDKYDYRWQPAPATLRRLAETETFRVQAVCRQLRDLVVAEPAVEFSESHRATMRERFAALVKNKLSPSRGNEATGERIPASSEDAA